MGAERAFQFSVARLEWPATCNHGSAAVMEDTEQPTFDLEPAAGGQAHLILRGRLDRATAASVWRPSTRRLRRMRPKRLIVQAGDVTYCDGAGVALLVEYRRIQKRNNGQIEIRGLRLELRKQMDLFEAEPSVELPQRIGPLTGGVHDIGLSASCLHRDLLAQVSFTGELFAKLLRILVHPLSLRWRDTFLVAEKAGANAVGITVLLGFLIGLILAFQSAAAMQKFGAEIFVADLVAIALFREAFGEDCSQMGVGQLLRIQATTAK